MGVKMPKAYYTPQNKLIDVHEAEKLSSVEELRGKLLCGSENCRARLKFVPLHPRGEESESTVLSHFSLVSSSSSPHSDDCVYNVSGQVRIIAREADDMMESLENGQYNFRLHLISNALTELRGSPHNASGSRPSRGTPNGQVGTTYETRGRLTAYLSTAKKIMQLRSKVESDSDLAHHIKIRFRGKEIRWGDFYFEREALSRCYTRISEHDHPVCIEGVVASIEKPSEKWRYTIVRLRSTKPTEDGDGFKYIPVVQLNFPEEHLAHGIQDGSRICVYGFATAKTNIDEKKSIKWLNISMWVNFPQQVFVVSY